MTRSNFLIGIAVAILTFSAWAYFNRPYQQPAWPSRILGFSFSPYRAWQSPIEKKFPTEDEIDQDLSLLSGKTHAIRTYTMESTLAKVPELAVKHKINVMVCAWIDERLQNNENEIEAVLKAAATGKNIIRILVGNETVLREDVPLDQMIGYIDRVRRQVDIPVSTAEPWHIWLKYPELVDHVDFLAVQMLPYWEELNVDDAVDYIVRRVNELKEKYPDKPIVLSEVGWPSNGRTRGSAVASEANEAAFLRRFLSRAEKEKFTYYIMEAFDQPWKRETIEGAVGAYWGVYDVNRKSKFPFTDPIVPIPQWYVLASISVIIAGITLAFLLIDSQSLRGRGRSFLAIIAFGAATAAVWIIYDYIDQYLTISSVIVGILMFFGMIGVILVILAEAHEWAEALWVTGRRRALKTRHIPEEELPMVSIHVPAYNEPPDMMIATLNALTLLDYPRFEVLVIDNNTKDPAVWEPVQAHCEKLGPRFRFFHVSPLAGFKAGALNYALRQTSPEAEIIAVIDSDYQVSPMWLKDLVPQFTNPDIGLVQAPQDYHDERENAFKAMCYAEYRAFFYVGMIVRNERNAIIQHGTMTLVRHKVLSDLGGWGEWCITEDTELGLRIFEQGYESIYIPKSYGKGVMPDTFIDFKKQRFRWAYGAIQILKRHFWELLGKKPTRLNRGQRYHFIAGWLPWIADGVNLIIALAAIFWSVAMTVDPKHVDSPMLELSLLPLSFFCFKATKMVYLYRTRVRSSIRQTIAAALAGLALSHTIARAVLVGFTTKSLPFFRTPKMTGKPALFQSIMAAGQEWLMLIGLLGSAVAISVRSPSVTLDLRIWILVLIMQSISYFSAVIVSLISGFPKLSASLMGAPLPEGDQT